MTTTFSRPLYIPACVRRHLQLRTGGFCRCNALLPARPCWWQPEQWDQREDAGDRTSWFWHTLEFGGTGLCSYRVRGVDGSCAEDLTVEP